MKIQFLGTAAAEGIPAIFCNCRICENARKERGKHIRHRAAILVNEDLMVDFGPDTFSVGIERAVDFRKVKYILITHSHSDHVDLLAIACNLIRYRKNGTPINHRLKIICTSYVESYIKNGIKRMGEKEQEIQENFQFIVVKPGDEVHLEQYKVSVIASNHDSQEQCVLYLISDGNKMLFYATDTKGYSPNKLLEKCNGEECIDVVISDCTYGSYVNLRGRHMGLPQNVEIRREMKENRMVSDKFKYILTHITHNAQCTHNELEGDAAKYGMEVAYDGLRIDV